MFGRIACVLLFMGFASLQAQNSQEVNPYLGYLKGLKLQNYSLTSNYRSKYVFSTAANLYDKPVIQTDLFLQTKCGMFLDIWNSVPVDLRKIGENYGTELYATVGWMGKVETFNLFLGVGYEDLYHTLSPEGTDFLIFSAELSRDFTTSHLTLTPFGKIEINFTLDGTTMAVPLSRIGLRYSYKLSDHLSVGGRMMVVYDPGLVGGDKAFVGNADTALFWKLGKSAALELPFVRYVSPLNRVHDGRKGDMVYGMGLAFNF